MGGLYNMLMGVNPAFGLLMAMVGITKDNAEIFGRVRDAWISEDGKTIGILHRNYGEDSAKANAAAAALPLFREQQACDDATYQVWLFNVSDQNRDIALEVARHTDTMPCYERYTKAIEDMRNNKDTPQTQHMLKVGEKIIGDLKQSIEDGKTRGVEEGHGGVIIITPRKEE